MLTTQQHLDSLDSAIQQRLNGAAYEGYAELESSFNGASLDSLYKIRRGLLDRLAHEGGNTFSLAEPFEDGNAPGPITLW